MVPHHNSGRRVFRALVLAVAVFVLAVSSAAAYPWPIKPFNAQHAIRGNFDDPRALREIVDAAGYNPLSFHSGVDIQAPDGTPVYAVESGEVTFASASAGVDMQPVKFSSSFVKLGSRDIVPVAHSLQVLARS